MTKKSTKRKAAPAAKSIFRKAGEVIGTLGHEIVEGKDMLVEASQAAVEKISGVKESISKKIAGPAVKKGVKKKADAAGKQAKKVVKKLVKKAIPKKTSKGGRKKPAAKKSATRK